MIQIVEGRKPVIAKVHGAAFAAGCQLVASCDLAYSTKDALFATPGVNIGLFCSTPMVAVSRKINRKPMMKMLLTGEPINANYAKEIGLRLIYIYSGLTALCALSYWVFGMGKFDSLTHSMTTIATGGFSNYNQDRKSVV